MDDIMNGVFVIGTDTGVGKTVICAGLLKLLHTPKKAVYWKPVQTGTIVGDDTKAVRAFSTLPADACWEPCYRFPEPLSPHMAAQKWGKTVEPQLLKKAFSEIVEKKHFAIVEGAGGILVPLNEEYLQIRLVKDLGLPVLLVSEDRVGAINQTLLTLNALRTENIPTLGVILTKARKTLGNAQAIAQFGKVEILAEFDPTEDSRMIVAQVSANDRLRQLFDIQTLPS